MALNHASFTLAANTATLIAEIPAGNPLTSVTITNVDSASVYIGDATVATGASADRGIRVATNTNQQVYLNAGDKLYAISLAGTAAYAVAVLYSNVLN